MKRHDYVNTTTKLRVLLYPSVDCEDTKGEEHEEFKTTPGDTNA